MRWHLSPFSTIRRPLVAAFYTDIFVDEDDADRDPPPYSLLISGDRRAHSTSLADPCSRRRCTKSRPSCRNSRAITCVSTPVQSRERARRRHPGAVRARQVVARDCVVTTRLRVSLRRSRGDRSDHQPHSAVPASHQVGPRRARTSAWCRRLPPGPHVSHRHGRPLRALRRSRRLGCGTGAGNVVGVPDEELGRRGSSGTAVEVRRPRTGWWRTASTCSATRSEAPCCSHASRPRPMRSFSRAERRKRELRLSTPPSSELVSTQLQRDVTNATPSQPTVGPQ